VLVLLRLVDDDARDGGSVNVWLNAFPRLMALMVT